MAIEHVAVNGASAGRLRRPRLGLLVAAVVAAMLIAAPVAQAETWTVTGTGDGVGSCSGHSCTTLRKAVEEAAVGDTISLGSATYTLEKEDDPLSIEKDLTIAGAGPGATTITTNVVSQLIYLDEAELALTGITLKGGVAPPSGSKKEDSGEGGAIYSDDGVLRISNCVFSENSAQAAVNFIEESNKDTYAESGKGGAIYSYGQVSIANSIFSDDTADGASVVAEGIDGSEGGAIYSYGSLKISSSTFENDTADGGGSATKYSDGGGGGAVYLEEGQLSVLDSTFSADKANGGSTTESGKEGGEDGYAGALYADGTATIAGSVFDDDTAGAGANGTKSDGDGGYGGAIYADESLTLSTTTVSGNAAAAAHDEEGGGGGVYADGNTTISQSTIAGNLAPNGEGAGIYNDGLLAVVQSTVSGNQTQGETDGGDGGGIYNDGYGLQLTQSTVGPANTAGDGGGIYNDDGPAALTNVTIAGNKATEEGGGIYNDALGTLANVTLFGNTAEKASGGGNLYLDDDELALHDTLIAAGSSPTSGGNCAFESKEALIVSKGYNAEDSNQCQLGGAGDKVNASLDLGPLQSNGGPTATIALLPGSSAIEAGDPAGCTDAEGNPLSVDQRGIARPQGPRCDIGAYEYVPPPVPIPAPAPVAPVDKALKLSPSSFAPDSSGASIARAHHKKASKKPPKGTTVSYTDSQAASTTLTVVEMENGYRVGKGSCKAPPKHGKKPKHAKGCTRAVTIGSFTHTDVAGANSFKFSGRVAGHALVRGSYQLKVVPKVGTLSGAAVSASFKIV